MATRRSSRSKPASKTSSAASAATTLKPKDLARFLGLPDNSDKRLSDFLSAGMTEADAFIGQTVTAGSQSHIYRQGVLHLAAKFYAVGSVKIEQPTDIPPVCRYFFELVRRELSSPSK